MLDASEATTRHGQRPRRANIDGKHGERFNRENVDGKRARDFQGAMGLGQRGSPWPAKSGHRPESIMGLLGS